MPTARRMNHIHILVRDRTRAIAFYENVLGMKQTHTDVEDGEELIFMETEDGDVLTLNVSTHGEVGVRGGLRHFGFVIPADSFDEARSAVTEYGGKWLGFAEWDEKKTFAYVKDPDGYVVELHAKG